MQGVRLTREEAELLRLWRSTDDHGHRHVMDAARLEAAASREARAVRLRVLDGGLSGAGQTGGRNTGRNTACYANDLQKRPHGHADRNTTCNTACYASELQKPEDRNTTCNTGVSHRRGGR